MKAQITPLIIVTFIMISCNLPDAPMEVISEEFVCGGIFTDPRDSKEYATVWIDENGGHNLSLPGKCWMAESINFDTGFSRCFDDEATNCNTYGRLYASQALANVCQNGWHIPSSAEWSDLFTTFGWAEALTGNGPIYTGNINVFQSGGNSGINILSGGCCFNNTCDGIGSSVTFWASDNSAAAFFNFGGNGSVWAAQFQGNFEYYVRCIKDN